jgi:GNAT superfamily N-acetyltransferase
MNQVLTLEHTAKFDIRPIQVSDHEAIKNFKCGNSSLDRYLKQNAYYDTIDLLACTNLVFYNSNLIGYFSLRKAKLNVDASLDELDYDYSLDITRLAVDEKYQKNGFGTLIVRKIVEMAKTVNERFVTLDALIEVHPWYTKRGFISFIEEEEIRSNEVGLVYMLMDLYDPLLIDQYLLDEIG